MHPRAMDTSFKFIILFIIFIIYAVYKVDGECSLVLNKDFGLPSPVYLRNGKYLSPNNTGAVVLQKSDTVLVACPGAGRRVFTRNITTGYVAVEAHCIINTTFRVERWIGQFSDIRCNRLPTANVKVIREKCYAGNSLIRVGYDIQSKIYPLYEACFDRNLLTTLYVKYQLTPASVFHESKQGSEKFCDSTLFKKVNINKAYTQQSQQIDAILGPEMYKKYANKTQLQYISRGHLAARGDFIMRGQQTASYHYVNSAPQWQRGNAGDWAALESALRRRINTYGSPVVVYTGTMGVMSLPDNTGQPRDLYLEFDENNNGILPVPLYFFKLVYDPVKKSAAAFVSINSSFYNGTVVERLTFCDAKCSRHAWLRWRNNDGTHSFCCDYAALAAAVPHTPQLDVKEIFE